MKISGNSGFGGDTTKAVYNDLYDDNEDIVRGHWYKMKLDIRFDPSGKGYAEIWRDGKKIVEYDGPLGYSNQKVTYWKQGVYRSTAPETLAVSYKDLKIHISPASTEATRLTCVRVRPPRVSPHGFVETPQLAGVAGDNSNLMVISTTSPG